MFAPQFARAGIVPVMGVGSVSDSKQPEPSGTGICHQRDSGARRHGHRGHLHGHLHGRAASAGVRSSTAAIRHGGSAHDQSGGAGHAALAAECFQDRKRHRTCGRVRAGSPHRHHGRVWQTAGDDSGHFEYSRRGGEQAISLRSAEQRQPEPAGHDGHGIQRAAWRERVRRRHHLPHEWPDQREWISRRHGAEHVCPVGRRSAGRGHGGAVAGRTLQRHLRQSLQCAWHSRRPA